MGTKMFNFKVLISSALVILVLAISSCLSEPRGLIPSLPCPEDLVVDAKLKDKRFADSVVRCLSDEGPCETDLAIQLKRVAPDIMRGVCPRPCSRCTRKQVSKAILFMQRNYPAQFSKLTHRFTNGRR